MSKTKRLTHVQEIELCREAQGGSKKAMEKMVTHNLGLVNKVAKKLYYKNEQYSFDDMFQEGVFGLIRAIEKFEPKAGCRFSTYSYYWIYCYVSRYHTNNHGKIRIPSHLKDKIRSMEKSGDERLTDMKGKIPRVISLNQSIGEGGSIEDIIPQFSNNNEIDELFFIKGEMRRVLSEREYEVLCYRYGLNDYDAKTQRECAEIYGVSYTTIYMIEKKAIDKLKIHFDDKRITVFS